MLVVIDYNVGNVKSVCNAFDHLGCPVELSCDRRKIKSASALVLPGVAAFGFAVNALGSLDSVIKDLALAGKPLLGICVGFQMLFDKSCEFGTHNGLGLVSGDVVAIPPGRVIPHMGWNKVVLPNDMALFAGLGGEKHFYFAHSFCANVTDKTAKVAYTDYGFKLPASIQKGNIYGTQFHPEKSGQQGLQVLRNFARIANGSNA
ncbi:MAG: imidazole glycerol phosphate synthase subunit HisH [Sedimentisphaerales bacterium]|jgi:glutamine amidotransferase